MRLWSERIFFVSCCLTTVAVVAVLVVLLSHIFREGWSVLSFDFFSNFPSRRPSRAGIKAALWGSLWVMVLTAMISIPVGVATAICLEEYMPKNRWAYFLQVNISNLSGMPSIIYGLLGLAIFVRFLSLERSILSGALTLSLLILPVIVVTAQGAIRAVPMSLREAAYSLGAHRWQVLLFQVLPMALPGIMTGVILALSRAIGETAPLIVVGALSYVAFVPESIRDPFTVLPIQIYNWAERPQEEFHALAAGGIIALLTLLLSMNFLAVLIRNKFQRYR